MRARIQRVCGWKYCGTSGEPGGKWMEKHILKQQEKSYRLKRLPMENFDKYFEKTKDLKYIDSGDPLYHEMIDSIEKDDYYKLKKILILERKILPIDLLIDRIANDKWPNVLTVLIGEDYPANDFLKAFIEFLRKNIYTESDLEIHGVNFKTWTPRTIKTPFSLSFYAFLKHRFSQPELIAEFNELLPEKYHAKKIDPIIDPFPNKLLAELLVILYKKDTIIEFIASGKYEVSIKKLKSLEGSLTKWIRKLAESSEFQTLMLMHLMGLPDNLVK